MKRCVLLVVSLVLGVCRIEAADEKFPYFGVCYVMPGDMETWPQPINDVIFNSPADMARIRPGDIIESIDGKEVKSYADLLEKLKLARNGNEYVTIIQVGILREDKKQNLFCPVLYLDASAYALITEKSNSLRSYRRNVLEAVEHGQQPMR